MGAILRGQRRGAASPVRHCARSPRTRRRALLVALALLTASSLACWLRTPEPALEIEVPVLTITRSEPAADGPVRATLELDGRELPAELVFSEWPATETTAAGSQIDVVLEKKARLLGMRRFELHPPQAVGFQSAPLIFHQLRREGVLTPRLRFVRVALDEDDLGLMALEEGISKELLESQQRREGVVFHFEPSRLPTARVVAYQARRVDESKAFRVDRATAAGLLQAFLRGDLPAEAVFDVGVLSRFLAVATLWDARAMLRSDQLRFYFNPLIQRLEPVASSAGLSLAELPSDSAIGVADWAAQLLADEEIRDETARAMQRIGAEFSQSARPGWFSTEAERLSGMFRVSGVDGIKTRFGKWAKRAARLRELTSVDLDALARADAPATEALRRVLLPDPEVASMRANPIPAATLEQALARHPFLHWHDGEPLLSVSEGDWTVAGSLVLPAGLGLDIGPGTTLRFAPDAILLASGPLRFHGREDAPVTLRGQGGEQAGKWQGVVVLRSATPVEWRHVVVEDTTGVEQSAWRLTGAVTFRAADVRISDSRFTRNSAEDALNLIRSQFDFRGVSIVETASDAFDCDFCDGRVGGGRIADAGGDGIDVSGSVIEVIGTVLEDIDDKAVSVGEGSRLTARDLSIRRVGTAVAGKDGSTVVFENSEVTDVRHVAVMSYTKKPEYGPADVTARNLVLERVGRVSVAQHGNRLVLDGDVVPTEHIDVDDLYKRGYMKK